MTVKIKADYIDEETGELVKRRFMARPTIDLETGTLFEDGGYNETHAYLGAKVVMVVLILS